MSEKIKKTYDEKNAELKIVVPIEKELWKKEQIKAFERLAKSLKLKGYRVGKVPMEIAKKHILSPQIWESAISKLLNEAASEAAKNINNDDMILDSPTYAVEKVSDDELEITFIYPIFPNLKIKDFKNYKINFDNPSESDIKKESKKQINSLLTRGSILLPKESKDAKVEDGDTVIIDFKGFVDNKPFEGGEAEKYQLVIGSKSFIPGFEDQLIGKSLNWSGDIKVTFPEEYFSEELRNKEARFEIKIHEIKYLEKQKLTDDFIKNLNIKDVQNEKQLNDYLDDLSKRELIEKSRVKFMNEFVGKVIKDNEIPTPRTIVLKELQALMKKFEDNLKAQGFSKKDYFEATGYNDEKVKKELMVEAERSVKKSIIYSTLAKDLKIKPIEEDYNLQYQRMAKLYNMDPQIIYENLKKEQIETPLINELLIDQLIKTLNPNVKLEKEKVTFVPKKKENKTNDKDSVEVKEEKNK